ncbi:glycosyltransferase [Epilithonimonas sp. UC225_85]|uniref:glycosyltransferase n=1 Tax=Epilithonimonas sp. UC225_85 TaxID=3350167 RepID=UPI0036D3FFB4
MEQKLAVIIPFFKIDFFEDTLKNLANQTDPNFNVYIGNDASSADPYELIQKYNKNQNIFYTKFDENLGGKGQLVEQWDRCIALSKDEDWLMILADDDYLAENFVEEFYKAIPAAKKESSELMRFKMRRVTEDNTFLIDLEQHPLYKAEDYIWDDLEQKMFISISENVFSRKMYEKKGLRNYPLAWKTDLILYLDFANNHYVLGVNSAFVAIRRSSQQITRRTDLTDHKNIALGQYYYDVLNEFSSNFKDYQNLKFLKLYTFYSKKNNLPSSLSSLYYKYGGLKELLKYRIKSIFNF